MNGKQDDPTPGDTPSPKESSFAADSGDSSTEAAEAPVSAPDAVAPEDAAAPEDKADSDNEAKSEAESGGEESGKEATAAAKPAKIRRPRPEEFHHDDPFGGPPPWLQRGSGKRTALGICLTLALVAVVGAVGWALFRGDDDTIKPVDELTADSCFVTEAADDGLAIRLPELGNTTPRQTATITTNYGQVTVLLFGDVAPCGVSGFNYLATQGFYANNACYRITTQQVEPTVTLRCGDPAGTGKGGPGYRFRAEQKFDGLPGFDSFALINDRSGNAGSSFAFVRGQSIPTVSLSVIGQVIDGFEILDQIGGSAGFEPYDGVPPQAVTILSITVAEGTVTLPPSPTGVGTGRPSPTGTGSPGSPSDSGSPSGSGSPGTGSPTTSGPRLPR